MFLIFMLALLLFGPKKLPELGRMLGKGLSEFRRAKNELKSTFETHMRELERETRLDSASDSSIADYSSRPYPYPYDEYGHSGSENGYTSGVSADTQDASSKPYDSEAAESAQPAPSADPVNSSSEQTQVAGTVPRSNGVQPIEHVSVSAEEDHRG
jgi:TatA/E family protein of Tat protein translocase